MRKSPVILILIIVSAAVSIFMLSPERINPSKSEAVASISNTPGNETDASESTVAPQINEADVRRRAMQQAYSQLQQSRQELKSQANMLKSKIWGLELPAAQAREVSMTMRRAYAYLKNPPMLGAFFEVDDIKREIKRVQSMQKELEVVEGIISSPP